MKKQGNLLSNFTAAPAQAQSSNGRARTGMPKLRAGRITLQYPAIPCNTASRIIPVPGKIAQIKNLSASPAVNALPDASPGRPEMITLRRWVAAPSIGLVLFLALMTLAFLYVQDAELEQQKQTHSRNLDLAQKALKLHWQDQIDSLAAAGQAWNAAGTDMPGDPTQSSPAEFLRRNPDLAWVGALDRGGKLLWIEVQRATERPASRQPGGVIAEPASATAARRGGMANASAREAATGNMRAAAASLETTSERTQVAK